MDAGRQAVTAIVKHALETAQAKDECLRLARYCVRLELVLVELQLLQRSNEALRGEPPGLGAAPAGPRCSMGRGAGVPAAPDPAGLGVAAAAARSARRRRASRWRCFGL